STRCDRPYRAGMRREESLALLKRMAGKSFDPVVVETFVRNVEHFDGLISDEDLREQVQSTTEADALAVRNGETLNDAATRAEDATMAEDGAAGFRSIAEAQREVFALHEIAQTIGSSLNLEDTVTLVAAKLRSVVPFDTC